MKKPVQVRKVCADRKAAVSGTNNYATNVLPATGGWFDDDHPGEREFFELSPERGLMLDSGTVLRGARLAYETYGTLNADGSNAVLVHHALTGDMHPASHPGRRSEPGWWERVVGPGRTIDTNEFFVVCANVLGGCQGSTGPLSINPATGSWYGPTFPQVTVRDQVRAQAALADHLGIGRWLACVGGSMGGMLTLEWAITYPQRVRSVVAIATTAAATPQQIAWSFAGRQAIVADHQFHDGWYYDKGEGNGPHRGLAAARVVGMIHYRSDDEFNRRFGRNSRSDVLRDGSMFDIERYLTYQSDKFVRRFDANSYVVLNRMMDLHDVGRGRGGVDAALRRAKAPLLTASVVSDFLYPPYQQLALVDGFEAAGQWAQHIEIDADTGHDGFLTHGEQVEPHIHAFLDKVSSTG